VPWLPWPVSCNGDSRLAQLGTAWHLQFLGNLQGIEPSLSTNQLLPVVALEAPAAQAPKISKVRLVKISHYWSPLLITFDHIWSHLITIPDMAGLWQVWMEMIWNDAKENQEKALRKCPTVGAPAIFLIGNKNASRCTPILQPRTWRPIRTRNHGSHLANTFPRIYSASPTKTFCPPGAKTHEKYIDSQKTQRDGITLSLSIYFLYNLWGGFTTNHWLYTVLSNWILFTHQKCDASRPPQTSSYHTRTCSTPQNLECLITRKKTHQPQNRLNGLTTKNDYFCLLNQTWPNLWHVLKHLGTRYPQIWCPTGLFRREVPQWGARDASWAHRWQGGKTWRQGQGGKTDC